MGAVPVDRDHRCGERAATGPQGVRDRQFTPGGRKLAGNEYIAFSPDGRWILAAGEVDTILVDAQAASVVELPIDGGGATWWPRAGASSLLLWDWSDDGATQLSSFDLTTLTRTPIGSIRLDETPGLDPYRRFLMEMDVAPDGESLLCTTFIGPPAGQQETHGSSSRWARGRFVEGGAHYAAEIEEIAPWSLDGDPTAELTHRGVQWTSKDKASQSCCPTSSVPDPDVSRSATGTAKIRLKRLIAPVRRRWPQTAVCA